MAVIAALLGNYLHYALWAIGILIVLAIGYAVTRVVLLLRGVTRREERVCAVVDPIAERLENGDEVTPDEIQKVAVHPEYRLMLYQMLDHYDRTDLLHEEHLTGRAQAEAFLCFWMLHPFELGEPPESIHLVETDTRRIGDREGRFYVFRFRMPEGHWAADEGWELGLAGPLFDDDKPYPDTAGAFSRGGDHYGEAEPSELIDWYVDMAVRKGLLPRPR